MSLRFKAILPKKVTFTKARPILVKRMRLVAKQIKKDLLMPTSTWDTKVKFQKEETISSKQIREFVFTLSDVYRWVSEGTKPHPIAPRDAPQIAYQSIFTPKTAPGRLQSVHGGKYGPWVVYPKGVAVQHPGIEPREFVEEVEKWRQPWFEKEMTDAMDEVAKSTGHKYP